MNRILLIIFSVVVFSSCNKTTDCEKEIYLLPPGFRGELIVYFDQDDGQPEIYEDSARVYRIPRSGYLKTRFQKNGGCMTDNRIRFFYEDSSGNREELDYFLNLNKDSIPTNRDYVLFTLLSDKDSKPDFVIHLIGTVQEFKELTNGVRNLDPIGILDSM